jgi:hypothetical protein
VLRAFGLGVLAQSSLLLAGLLARFVTVPRRFIGALAGVGLWSGSAWLSCQPEEGRAKQPQIFEVGLLPLCLRPVLIGVDGTPFRSGKIRRGLDRRAVE